MQRLLFTPTHWISLGLRSTIAIVAPIVFLWTGLSPVFDVTPADVVYYFVPMVLALGGGVRAFAPGQHFALASQVQGTFLSFKILPTVLETLVRWGWPREAFVHIPNFVDVDHFRPGSGIGRRFVYCGRLDALKGVETLVRAAAWACFQACSQPSKATMSRRLIGRKSLTWPRPRNATAFFIASAVSTSASTSAAAPSETSEQSVRRKGPATRGFLSETARQNS